MANVVEFGKANGVVFITELGNVFDAMTVQCWVHPPAYPKVVSFFSGPLQSGHNYDLGVGFHTRVDLIPTFRLGIESLRMPVGFTVYGFSEADGTGSCVALKSTGTNWANFYLKSVLIIHEGDPNPTYCVAQNEDSVLMLPFGRIAQLSTDQLAQLDQFHVPPGLQVTVFDHPNCHGTSQVIAASNGPVALDFTPASLMVTRDPDTKGSYTSIYDAKVVPLFQFELSDPIVIVQTPTANPVEPPRLTFGSRRLRRGKWVHLACTFDGQTQLFFVDGVLVDEVAQTKVPQLDPIVLIGEGFAGQMWSVRIHSAKLSQDQIADGRFAAPDQNEPHAIFGCEMSVPDDQLHDTDYIYAFGSVDSDGRALIWSKSTLPESSTESPLAQRVLLARRGEITDQMKAHHDEDQRKVQRVHTRLGEKMDAEHARIEALTYASNLEGIFAINGKDINQYDALGNITKNWSDHLKDFGDYRPDAFCLDSVTGDLFVSLTLPWSLYTLYPLVRIAVDGTVTSVYTAADSPIRAMAFDPSGWTSNSVIYFAGGGNVYSKAIEFGDDQAPSSCLTIKTTPNTSASGWSMTIDQKRKVLVWSDGTEIWSTTIRQSASMTSRILVTHGQSPNPIALLCEEDTGDVFWIDGSLDLVRRCTSDGERIWDLYPAPAAGKAIAIDYFDASHLRRRAEGAREIAKRRRIYWTSRSVTTASAYKIDVPSVICDLRHSALRRATGTPDHVGDIVHLMAAEWKHASEDAVKLGDIAYETHYTFTTHEGEARALVTKFVKNDVKVVKVIDIASGQDVNVLGHWSYENDGYMPLSFTYDRLEDVYIVAIPTDLGGSIQMFKAQRQDTYGWRTKLREMIQDLESSAPANFDKFSDLTPVCMSYDTKTIAIGLHGARVQVWSGIDLKILHIFQGPHGYQVSAVELLTLDGRSYVAAAFIDYSIRLWDLATGRERQLIGATGCINVLRASPDQSKILAIIASTVMIWDVDSSNFLKTLEGHDGSVIECILHPDGERAMSSGSDHTIRIWDIHTGACLRTIDVGGDARALTLGGDGRSLFYQSNGFWQVDLHHHPYTLAFNGEDSGIVLGDLVVNFDHGFGAEVQIKPSEMETSTIFALGEDRATTVRLDLSETGAVNFVIGLPGDADYTMLSEKMPGRWDDWHTITVTMDVTGTVQLQIGIDVKKAAALPMPVNGHRTGSTIGRPAGPRIAGRSTGYFKGEIAVVRLWNRSLTLDEIKAFHMHPMRGPNHDTSEYVIETFSRTSAQTYLMSGMDDASSPPEPLFKFASDVGLELKSRTSTLHDQLLAAQQDKIALDRENHRLLRVEQEESAKAMAAAIQRQKEGFELADVKRDAAQANYNLKMGQAEAEVYTARQTRAAMIKKAVEYFVVTKANAHVQADAKLASDTQAAKDRRAEGDAKHLKANKAIQDKKDGKIPRRKMHPSSATGIFF